MTHPYGPRQQPHWRPPPGWSPDLPLPPSPPPIRPPSSSKPKRPVSGTANAALLVAVLSIPPLFFGLPAYAIATVAGLVSAAQILGCLTFRRIRQGRADPISRQRAVLAMGISGVSLLVALGIFVSSLVGG